MSVKAVKTAIRERTWRLLEERGVARFPRPVKGRIPNFAGAEEAAARLFTLDVWRRSQVVKANPDSPQKPVRLATLRQGKLLVMATPRLRQGFLLLDPKRIPPYLYEKAATIRGAFQLGKPVGLDELKSIGVDLIVTGSVAVDVHGNRVGKGEGYAELEYGIARELGIVSEETPVATTVHDLQIVNSIPREPYDLTVDIIATPTKLVKVEPRPPKPPGIIWELLPCEKLQEIPVLQELAKRSRTKKPCRD